jgi:hypothetical protein
MRYGDVRNDIKAPIHWGISCRVMAGVRPGIICGTHPPLLCPLSMVPGWFYTPYNTLSTYQIGGKSTAPQERVSISTSPHVLFIRTLHDVRY